MLPGSNDSKQMCPTVCLGSPGLKFCLLHSNCFLHFLSVSPPWVPPSLKGAPDRASLCQAGLGPTGDSDPAGLFSSLSLCKMAVVLCECFSHHKCWLGRGPGWKPRWKSFQNPAPEIQLVLSARLRRQAHRYCRWGGTSVGIATETALIGFGTLCRVWTSASTLSRRIGLEEPWWPCEAPLGLAGNSLPCHVPSPTLLSRNSNLCQARESDSQALPETDWNPQNSDLQTFKITYPYQ